MKGLMRDNLCIAKRFSDTVRYIDDLLTLNNTSFEEEIIKIYPPELTLKKLLNLILEYHILTFPSVSATIMKALKCKPSV